MAQAREQSAVVYRGNCHCGRYRFEVSVPEIKDAVACTCSLCAKKGYLWLVPPDGAFKVVRDDGSLRGYRSPSLQDRFCSHCGTGVVGEHLAGPLSGRFAVNVRAIQGVNPFEIEPAIKTAKVTEEARAIEPLTESSPGRPAELVFSCHCGKVQAELLVPIQGEEVKEDNCSLCVRNGYIGVYPTKDNVRIHGRDNAFEYVTGRKLGGVAHCATCGVHVFSNIYGPPICFYDNLPAERRERARAIYHRNMNMQPLNVRAADGLDLASLFINRADEGTEGYELDP